jgi:hypothetical protein
MNKKITLLLLIIFNLFFVEACGNGLETAQKTTSFKSINDITLSAWTKLSQKKIIFGHQSVGFDILNGVEDIKKEYPQIQLNIVESKDLSNISLPVFAHFKVGKNFDPESKIDSFKEVINSETGNQVDYAFFKFCFVDIVAETDVEKIFSEYVATMNELKTKFPKTIFIHITVPVTSDETGIKAWIKKTKDIVKNITGRTNYFNNSSRNKFNDMIRAKYIGREPVFDLAEFESSCQRDNRTILEVNKKKKNELSPEYAYEGGHLNKLGRKVVAEQFLIFLAEVDEMGKNN